MVKLCARGGSRHKSVSSVVRCLTRVATGGKELSGKQGHDHRSGPEKISSARMKMLVEKDDPARGKHDDDHDPENAAEPAVAIDQQRNERDDKEWVDPSAEKNSEVLYRSLAQHAHAIRAPRRDQCGISAQISGDAFVTRRGAGLPYASQTEARCENTKCDHGDQTAYFHSKSSSW